MSHEDHAPALQGQLYDLHGLGFALGQAIVVTGAGSGIGRATALGAAQAGLNVAAWDVNEENAAKTAEAAASFRGNVIAIKADVTDAVSVDRALELTLPLGACCYLVNNAGPPSRAEGPFADNLLRALGSVELVTTRWLDRCGSACDSLVNVASIAGNFHGGGKSIAPFYPAAKTGIVGYTRYLATQYEGRPRANAVAPGITITPRTMAMLDSAAQTATASRIPSRRPGFAEEVANVILFLLSPAASYVNGVLLPVDGGMSIA